MKGKLIILLVSMALLVGILSGCTETTTEENTAPVATFTSSVDHNTSMAGGTVTFDSTASDADNDTLTYAWDFGDGTGTSTDADPTYEYTTNGSFTVTLTVNDETNDTVATATVIVGNVAPVADFDYTATNLSVVFTDASTDVNTDDTLAYSWDFGDNTTASTEQNPTHNYTAAGNYNVTLTVTDSYGLTDDTTVEITVEEAATEE